MSEAPSSAKVKSIRGGSAFRKFRDITYGPASLGHVILAELIVTLTSPIPGALGLVLRKKLYPFLFKQVGRGVIFGRNLTVRHGTKIVIGDNVIIDDNAVLDAKGDRNRGITIGSDVYIGRNTIVYCKNGDMTIGDRVSLSSNCQVFSSNNLTIEPDCVIGAFTYILSGGEYDYNDREIPFSLQSGMETKGPLTIGSNTWIAAHVTVTDAANIGAHCVIGAGAVVIHPIPADSIAVGMPARAVKSIAD